MAESELDIQFSQAIWDVFKMARKNGQGPAANMYMHIAQTAQDALNGPSLELDYNRMGEPGTFRVDLWHASGTTAVEYMGEIKDMYEAVKKANAPHSAGHALVHGLYRLGKCAGLIIELEATSGYQV